MTWFVKIFLERNAYSARSNLLKDNYADNKKVENPGDRFRAGGKVWSCEHTYHDLG
jgi:hypothetical protein